MTQLPLRPNVCLLILNSADLIFLGERLGSPGVWQLPQGGVEPDESLEQNALREAQEELGVDIKLLKIEQQLSVTHEYEFRKVPDYAMGKWRGQKQTFWLLRFFGADSDINLSLFEAEFSNYQWCTIDQVFSLSEPIRITGYQRALEEVRQILNR